MARIGFIHPDQEDEIHEPVPGYGEAFACDGEGSGGVWSWLVTVLWNFFLVYGVIAVIRDVIGYFRG